MLEQELLEGLRPVAAPAGLWDRVGQVANLRPIVNRPARGGFTTRRRLTACPTWLLAPVAAVASLAIFLAIRPVANNRVKIESGPDLHFSERAGLRFVAMHDSKTAAEVGFTVGGRQGRLVVTKTGVAAGTIPHLLPASDARVYSWTAGGLAFNLECASPEDLRAACGLCHG